MLTKANETVRQLKEQYVKVSNTAGLTIRADRMALYGSKEKQSPILQMFSSMKDCRDSQGNFQIEKAKESYRKFLTNLSGKHKIYLEMCLDAVEFQKIDAPSVQFGFLVKDDVLYYNPNADRFDTRRVDVVFTHEFGHRFDHFFINSFEDKDFVDAIRSVKGLAAQNKDIYRAYCSDNDQDGFLSDLFGCIIKDSAGFEYGHEAKDLKNQQIIVKEVFANLFSLEVFNDQAKIEYLEKEFPEILQSYRKLIKSWEEQGNIVLW